MPCTMVHNVRAALPGRSVRNLVLLILLAMTVQFCYYVQSDTARVACQPFGPEHHHKHPHHPDPQLPVGHGDPEKKTFLAGATFNPAFLAEDDNLQDSFLDNQASEEEIQEIQDDSQETGFTVIIDGQPIQLDEFEATNAQIALAKNQALEGMNLLGRKLLHKGHHDDDEYEWKHHDDDEDDDDHDDDDSDDDNDDDEDDDDKHSGHGCGHHHDDKHEEEDAIAEAETFDMRRPERDEGPAHQPHDPECESQRTMVAVLSFSTHLCWGLVIVYGYRARKTMRKNFNIKGNSFKDCIAWVFCTPCAVCQETRTITKNNVAHGTWHNPTILLSPAPQKFESSEKASSLPV